MLVDEFQDTNRAQAELVALIAQRHRNVTVVGDDDQSIYKFRGAAISNILEFRERYRNARVVVLRRNYRSRGPILDAAYRLVRHNDPDRLEVRAGIVKRLVAERGSEDAAAVRHEAFATGAEEADWIAADIARRLRDGSEPRDVAILVRANAAADPVLRSLNLEGIPWRFSGTSGLYSRPEVRLLLAFLRAIADLSSSVDMYALAASELYGLGGEDLVAIVNMARRRNRSVWDVLEELQRQPGILRLSPETRASATRRLVEDLRAYTALAHERPAGEVLYAFLQRHRLAGAARRGRDGRRRGGAVEHRPVLRHHPRPIGAARRRPGPVRGPAPQDAHPGRRRPAHRGHRPRRQRGRGHDGPQGEGPGVPGRVPPRAGRPGGSLRLGRREPLPLPLELVHETLPEGDYQLQEERRLFYVGMTRARDELVLSHAADYGGQRARRVSPFVLEALDLPVAAGAPGAGTTAATPLERLQGLERTEAAKPAARGRGRRAADVVVLRDRRLPDLPAQVQVRPRAARPARAAPLDHLRGGAPRGRVRVPQAPRSRRGDGRGGAVGGVRAARGPTRASCRASTRRRAGRRAGRPSAGSATEQLRPGAVVPAYVERDFSFLLDGDRVRGRFDRVDIIPRQPGDPVPVMADDGDPGADVVEPTLDLSPERVVITDYKSSDVRDPAKARQRAKDSLQLSIYAMGYEAMTGRLPDAVALHFLESGLVGSTPGGPAPDREGPRRPSAPPLEGSGPETSPRGPTTSRCTWCAFREICPSSAAR